MKKIYVLLCLVVIIFTSCTPSGPGSKTILFDFTPYYRVPLHLNGQVKSLKLRTYWAHEEKGKIVKGSIITRPERDSVGLISDFNVFVNEEGTPTKTEYISYDGQINHYELEIQENRIVTATWYVNGEPQNYISADYDEDGNNIARETYKYGVDTLLWRSTATYFENGNVNEVSVFNIHGEQSSRMVYVWNDNNQVSEYLTYSPEGELTSKMTAFYNEHIFFDKAVFESPNRGVRTFEFKEFKTDKMDNVISYIAYRNGDLFSVNELEIEYY